MGIVQSLFGGPVAPLQPKGPAPFAQPDERDRQALFWWLKRNTSYTAIEHNSKLWADFAQRWEHWLRQQPSPYQHDVETLKYILDTQLAYERGLARLRQGDRSVFTGPSSESWFAKLQTQLPGRRYEWDAPTPDQNASMSGHPVELVRSYFKAHDAAMAVGHAISYFSLDNSPRSTARSLLAALSFDTTLPEPRWDIGFAPGKRAPKDGIYEQVDLDGHIVGGMAYFVKGQASEAGEALEFGPQAWAITQQRTSAFLWRLLWEDARYEDGAVPEEEQLYPLPGQSVEAAQTGTEPQRLRCEAGHPCPQEGWWFTPAKANSRRLFRQEELMPSFSTDYGATIWQWDERQEDRHE